MFVPAAIDALGQHTQTHPVLGGTFFLGPALVDALLADGHTVTLFNRGVTNPELFPHIEKLRGFRSPDSNDHDLSAVSHRHFDVIIDVWPNDPAVVQSAAEFLKDRAPHYLYVSSIAAYDSKKFAKSDMKEAAPMEPWNGSGRTYNRDMAESERRLHHIIGERLTIVRPGPIKGRRDTTPDLLTWLLRAHPNNQGAYRISSEKAFQAGWHTRPFEETAFDCLNDFHSFHVTDEPNFLSATKEKEVLDAWAKKQGG